MNWNYTFEEMHTILYTEIILLLSDFVNQKISKKYIYINLNKYLKIKNIDIKRMGKVRSVNTYIKTVYKTWDNLLSKLYNNEVLVSKDFVILCK